MPTVNIPEYLSKKAWSSCSKDAGKGLIVLGTAGWFFSALAQIVMISKNDDIDKKEKKFLIPQEASDGIINVGLYYTICQAIKSTGDMFTEKGKLMTQKPFDTLFNLKSDNQQSVKEFMRGTAQSLEQKGFVEENIKGNMSKFFNGSINYLKKKLNNAPDLPNYKCFESLTTPQQIQEQIHILQDTQKNFAKFKNGIGVLTAVGSSILACNVITPIARNYTANHFQKKHIARTKQLQSMKKTVTLPPTQIPSVFNVFRV